MTDDELVRKKLARIETCLRERVAVLRAMTGFRNVLVHEYDDVDGNVVRDILEHHLGDLDAFVAAIRARLT